MHNLSCHPTSILVDELFHWKVTMKMKPTGTNVDYFLCVNFDYICLSVTDLRILTPQRMVGQKNTKETSASSVFWCIQNVGEHIHF